MDGDMCQLRVAGWSPAPRRSPHPPGAGSAEVPGHALSQRGRRPHPRDSHTVPIMLAVALWCSGNHRRPAWLER